MTNTPDELERAVERLGEMADDLEEFEYLTPPRVQTAVDLRLILSERYELLATVEKMRGQVADWAEEVKDWAERIDAITWSVNTSALDGIISEMRRAALTTGEDK